MFSSLPPEASVFPTYPISSKCSLSTAQMVTHSVGVPVSRNMKALKRGFDHTATAAWSHGLTPANDDVPVEVSFLREEGLHQ